MAALLIDLVFLFGDCRPIHRAAHDVATAMGIDVGVFEEGYLRPDFITLERHGVNGNSLRRYDPIQELRAAARRQGRATHQQSGQCRARSGPWSHGA